MYNIVRLLVGNEERRLQRLKNCHGWGLFKLNIRLRAGKAGIRNLSKSGDLSVVEVWFISC